MLSETGGLLVVEDPFGWGEGRRERGDPLALGEPRLGRGGEETVGRCSRLDWPDWAPPLA